jgi:hypothetical protein
MSPWKKNRVKKKRSKMEEPEEENHQKGTKRQLTRLQVRYGDETEGRDDDDETTLQNQVPAVKLTSSRYQSAST